MTISIWALLPWLLGGGALSWLSPERWRLVVWLVSSYALLGWLSPRSALAFLVLTLAVYAAAVAGRRQLPWAFSGGIAALVLTLLVYRLVPLRDAGAPLDVFLVGFAFALPRAVHYLVETYKGSLPAHHLGHFAAYIAFMPTLSIGPIHRFEPFMRECRRLRWDPGLLSMGTERLLIGLIKIVFLGNYVVSMLAASWVAGLAPGAGRSYAEMWVHTLNLYFQFAGWSEVAVAVALLWGIRIEENFSSPLLATNLSVFWRRWHMSLSSWCRDYVYVPVLTVTRWPLAAIAASMVVMALWHEASWNYVAWGLFNACGIAAWHGFQRLKPYLPALPAFWRPVAPVVSWALTIHFIFFGFALSSGAWWHWIR